MLTLLGQFSDEYVKRIFINNNRIERTLLADTRAEAQRMAEEERDRKKGDAGGSALSADLYRVTAYSSVCLFVSRNYTLTKAIETVVHTRSLFKT